MGKLLGVVLVIIALASAYPILKNQYPLPEDISTHGHLIDEQLHDTMIEAGISFVGAQLVLAFFVWSFTGRKPGSPLKNFPGGAKVLGAIETAFELQSGTLRDEREILRDHGNMSAPTVIRINEAVLEGAADPRRGRFIFGR